MFSDPAWPLETARSILWTRHMRADGQGASMATVTVGRENSTAVELFYQDRGVGAPVVLVHGYPLAGDSWERQVSALLAEGHRVITYDRRGSGSSSRPSRGYDWDTLASDLNVLMTTLDLHQAAIAGHSLGTGDVMRYLSAYGSKRLSRAVLIAPLPLNLVAAQPANQIGADMTDRYADLSRVVDNYYNVDTFLGTRVSPEVVRHSWDAGIAASPEIAAHFQAASRSNFRAELELIDIPVLVISAGSDRLLPGGNSGRDYGRAPMLKSITIPNAPHGLLWTHADEVNAALLSFIDD
jgi:non-heme chloroperoxidase